MTLPRADLDFLLFDWLDAGALCARARFAHLDPDTLHAMLDAAQQLAASHFATHAAKSDANEPQILDGRVQLIPEIGAALEAFRDAGFFGVQVPQSEGGLDLPYLLVAAIGGCFTAANAGTSGYPFLTRAAANLLRAFGSDEQKRRLLPRMDAGEWFGTMCLSEPHAGSSVGDIRTSATPRADGRYAIRGSKMWISGGEHELAANIVHLVLAKIPGGPPGTKGISLFAVPRRRLADDGSVGARNGIALTGLNHKMGYRGTVNCLLDFGGDGDCIGELVGEPNQGMRAMFHMMNEARVGVGMGAAVLGWAGYVEALRYARERTQGRLPSQRDAAAPMQPLVAHADVRRMLLKAKAQTEGAVALCLYGARLVDEVESGDDTTKGEAQMLLDLLTPIVKTFPSEYALEANAIAIQVLGGAGYTRDFPLERLYRDNRLNPIHEGTTGIQALDLLGRKIVGDAGRGLALLAARMEHTLREAASDAELAPLGQEIGSMLPLLQSAVQAAAQRTSAGDVDLALANATLLLDALGHIVVSWLWLDISLLATRRLRDANPAPALRDLLEGKRTAARYFITWELPTKRHALALFARVDRTVFDTPPAHL
jgi:alkylation response protein AidB-like acyl-CoA dehydrogenase